MCTEVQVRLFEMVNLCLFSKFRNFCVCTWTTSSCEMSVFILYCTLH